MQSVLGRRGGVLLTVLLMGLVVLLTFAGVSAEERRHDDRVRAELILDGGRIRADLERTVDALAAGTEGLVGFATAQAGSGTVDAELFRWYAGRLEEGLRTPFRRIQLAPNAVIALVYPLEGNEDLVGTELMADPARRRSIERAIRARSTIVTGPVEVQGDVAIVARSPVFTPTEDGGDRFWGVATTLIAIDAFYEEAGLMPLPSSMDLALRDADSQDEAEVFLGSPEVFENDPILFDVDIPAGRWELAVVPAGGWEASSWPQRDAVLFGGVILALILGALVWGFLSSREAVRVALVDRAELIDTASSPIVQVSAAGEVTVWNSRAEEVSGVSGPEVLGTSVVVDDEPAEGFRAVIAGLLEETLRTGERIEGREVVVRRADDERLLLMFNTAPIFDERGRITDMVAIALDLTSRFETDRIRRENESLAEAARLKDEFLANMSHELRTPLNGIIGLSTLLGTRAAGELNEKQAEYVDHIQTSGTHLLGLINDILDMARLASGEQQGETEPVDAAQAAEAAIRLVKPMADKKNLPIRVEADGPAIVMAHERRLVQILVNLLSNAVKFTPEGQVTIRTETRGDEVVIEVADTGIGIPEDKMRLLFRPFMQVDASLNRPFEGSGLGLALSQRLVTMLGGRIGATSEEGHGSVFTLTFPAAGVGALDDPTVHVDGPPSPAGEPAKRVLVVESNTANRLVLVEYLTKRGYEPLEASDGFEALQAVRRDRPDAVLMDVDLPRMESLRATSIIKSDRETWEIPVIALMDIAREGDDARCLEAGCDAYVTKPVDFVELGHVLDGLLQRRDDVSTRPERRKGDRRGSGSAPSDPASRVGV